MSRLSVRWKLAIVSAALTFLILLGFALAVGTQTADRLRSDFDSRITAAAADLQSRLRVGVNPAGGYTISGPSLDDYVRAEPAIVRVMTFDGRQLGGTTDAPNLGRPDTRLRTSGQYRTLARPLPVTFGVPLAYVEYARPISQVQHTVNRLWIFLALGVFGGTVLALLAGLAVARRAMRPVAGLTAAAREIEKTRDPRYTLPQPRARDEVADLAKTLSEMLSALDGARRETEAALGRQRQFVADASHELRTPLTAILANLELLQDQLERQRAPDEEREIVDAALRSSRRMRRLVSDLLLLAHTDAGRSATRSSIDMGEVVAEVVTELKPLTVDHVLTMAEPLPEATVLANRDELHRMVVNLIDNSLRHTPAGTNVHVKLSSSDRETTLEVSDDGPGIPEDLRDRIFERFTRAGNDGGGGTGLGLAIVRAVAEAHHGSATLQSDSGDGTHFVVSLPVQAPG